MTKDDIIYLPKILPDNEDYYSEEFSNNQLEQVFYFLINNLYINFLQ